MNIKCFECDSEENIHNHHVIPKILGGTKTIPLCALCHGKVHDKDILKMDLKLVDQKYYRNVIMKNLKIKNKNKF